MFPIALDADQAARLNAPTARTQEEAERALSAPVIFVEEELSRGFADLAEIEEAFPEHYSDPKFDAYVRGGEWRVALRFFKPIPALPIGREAEWAARRPIGFARTKEEAEALAQAPIEPFEAHLARSYKSRKRAAAAFADQIKAGIVSLEAIEGRFHPRIRFWRILKPALSREDLETLQSQPLRSPAQQAPADIGLFEQQAPENPAIVLAEEGDGRTRGE